MRPNAALLDIGMPGMSGYDVATALRADPDGVSMLLVALTGRGQAADKQRAVAAGFDRQLTKPVDPQEIERILADRALVNATGVLPAPAASRRPAHRG